MTELGRRVLGLGTGFECCVSPKLLPWFNWGEQRNIYERGGLGATPSIFDQLAEEKIPYRVYSYQHASDRQILAQAAIDVEQDSAGFFFIYLCELDGFLHTHCNEPELIAGKLAWYEEQLRLVFQAALRRDREAKFFLFSDHGMTPVRRHYELAADIDRVRAAHAAGLPRGLRFDDGPLLVLFQPGARDDYRLFAARALRPDTARR